MQEFYHPERETLKHGGELPHWQQGEAMQFVTFRLADSMPKSKLRQWKEELAAWKLNNPEPWSEEQFREYHQRFTWKLEHWLDEGHGACILKQPANRSILEEILMRDEGKRAVHHSWVIMPNHVHLLVILRDTPAPDSIPTLVRLLKTYSARRINSLRCTPGQPVWQRSFYDHAIRDNVDWCDVSAYMLENPRRWQEDEEYQSGH